MQGVRIDFCELAGGELANIILRLTEGPSCARRSARHCGMSPCPGHILSWLGPG